MFMMVDQDIFSVSVNMINITRLTLSHNKIQGRFTNIFTLICDKLYLLLILFPLYSCTTRSCKSSQLGDIESV